jgi:hypothetical protein
MVSLQTSVTEIDNGPAEGAAIAEPAKDLAEKLADHFEYLFEASRCSSAIWQRPSV